MAPCFKDLGLKQASEDLFVSASPDLVRMVQVTFLNSQQAAYSGSTTASFKVEFGGLYGPTADLRDRKDFPRVHYCQVRGCLRRDFEQPAPKESLPTVEHQRRDIWWISEDGENLKSIVESATRVLKADLEIWLKRLADDRYICRHLFWKDEDDSGLYGFGRKGSPARTRLLGILTEKFPNKALLKWRLLLPA